MAEKKKSNVAGIVDRLKASTTGKVDSQVASRTEGMKTLEGNVSTAKARSTSRHSKRRRRQGRRELSAANAALSKEQAGIKALTSTDEYKRGKDVNQGAEFAAGVLGDEGLGRLSDDADVTDALARKKEIADKGLSREELAAERAQATRSIDSATQTSGRALQASLARSGVKGASAGQMQLQNQASGAQAKADLSQNLFLKSESIKREGLKDYSSSLGNMKSFDLGQSAKEKDMIVQSGLSFAQMGSGERTAKLQADISAKASVASARAGRSRSCFLGNTKFTMIDDTEIEFQHLRAGMTLKGGDLILGISQHIAEDQLFNYKGVMVTGHHFVWENNMFIPVMESEVAVKVDYKIGDIYVYNMITESGMIKIDNIIFADWEDDAIKEAYGKIQELRQGKIQPRNSGDS